MKPKSTSKRRGSPAVYLREQIEKAEGVGLSREQMTLRLTHGDASLLKRDPQVAVSEISFAGGVMRFLGVKVEEGGVTVSDLVPSD
jgi:hypothetical protein